MMYIRKKIIIGFVAIISALFLFAAATVFFDQAVLVRKGTFYHINVCDKIVALTFDDGPSSEWTPKILYELKKENNA